MDAPLCKICKTKHWNREPHAGMKAKPLAVAVSKAKSLATSPAKASRPRKADRHKPGYQAELMRQRRKKAQDASPQR